MTYEYRVRWRREERGPRTQIMQSERGAREKIERLKQIDGELSGERDWPGGDDPYGPERHPLEGLPPLEGEPELERREVGAWEAVR